MTTVDINKEALWAAPIFSSKEEESNDYFKQSQPLI